MIKKLFFQAIVKFFLGVMSVAVLIFLPAGTLDFPRGWMLMCLLFIPMFFAGIVIMIKDPKRLEKRLNMTGERDDQKIVIKLSGIMFVCGFVVAGLNFRFNWYTLPKSVSTGAMIIFLIAYILYLEVIRENEYLSRVIEISQGQKVVDTGMYSVIRHPMYAITLFLFLAMPLILGSLYAFLIFLAYPFIIAQRIKKEEAFLEKELKGYYEYKKKVRCRLIPFVW